MSFHCYADDLQIYLPIKPNDIKLWLSHNFLHLNEDKTECIIFGSTHVSSVNLSSGGALALFVKPAVRNLGVIFDRSLDIQINNAVKTSFFQLRLLVKVEAFLRKLDLEKAIHAFISSRLDYYNALYVGLNQFCIMCL